MSRTRTTMLTVAAGVAGLAIGVAGVARAASGPSTTTPQGRSYWGHHRDFGTEVTGASADKATAAALKVVPGTVERVVAVDGGGYVVHVVKADGSEVHVREDASFKVTGQEAGPGRGGPDGPRSWGHHHGFGAEATGPNADKAKAAALKVVPGTVERVVALPDGGYVVHVVKADGSEVHVREDASFKVTGQEAGWGRGGPDGPRGWHHHGDHGGVPGAPGTPRPSISA